LIENNRFRSSQPRQAPERQAVKKPSFFIFLILKRNAILQ